MDNCTCTYCYHNICFHPLRGDENSLGVPCDGCKLDDLPESYSAEPTITIPDDMLTTKELSQEDS